MRSHVVIWVFCLASLSIPASVLGRRSSCLVVVLIISLSRLACVVLMCSLRLAASVFDLFSLLLICFQV